MTRASMARSVAVNCAPLGRSERSTYVSGPSAVCTVNRYVIWLNPPTMGVMSPTSPWIPRAARNRCRRCESSAMSTMRTFLVLDVRALLGAPLVNRCGQPTPRSTTSCSLLGTLRSAIIGPMRRGTAT